MNRPFRDAARRLRATASPLLLGAAAAGCVAYEPAPVEPTAILAELRAVRLTAAPEQAAAGGFRARELAAFALAHDPDLRELRAEASVSAALLVEAGLLPDVAIGWDAMDALAAQVVERSVTTAEVLSGVGIDVPLLRPGERGARTERAEHELAEARAEVLAGEWRVARDVALACAEVRAAAERRARGAEAVAVAQRTYDHFAAAGRAGAATAVEVNLARGALLARRADALALEARADERRLALNALLGLPPDAEVPLASDLDLPPLADGGDAELVDRALALRPDLAAALAAYDAAEAAVRLEVVRQRPGITVGTGLTLELGLFNRFHRPAIETALARRERARGRVEAAVRRVRADVHAAARGLRAARRELELTAGEVLANAERSLALVEAAFAAGEATLLEVLAVQRDLVDASTRAIDARAAAERAEWELRAACGLLFPDHPAIEAP
jgi:outer membrane protein TolC